MSEEEHQGRINKIKKAIESKIKPDRIYKNFWYVVNNNNYEVDLLVQIGSTIYLFECKLSRKIKKAKKQLQSHKFYLINNQKIVCYRHDIEPFSNVKLFYVSEYENIVINIENGNFVYLNLDFYNDPIKFLVG